MREPPYSTREEYELTKVALARVEVPAEASPSSLPGSKGNTCW